ncbi:MAG: class I SAM-dependent methyltransferase [Pseudomonadota bacterium]|nr:class I SAM-dependent methyltransferase [Pseudomonadota bacterium]
MRNLLKSALARLFHAGQHVGWDILPRHFYSEIPDIRKLRGTNDWRQPYSMIDVPGAELDPQLRFVESTMTPAIRERLAGMSLHAAACDENGEPGYGRIESEFLYGFVATHQPARIVQIGCGVSTAVCLAAARDGATATAITCIEPYPTPFLRKAADAGRLTLVQAPVETLDLAFLEQMRSGDLFFVDSTHTLGPGGEVSRIILDMLPRLAPGVYAHFHDITFPYDYQGDVLSTALFCWHETTLLHGFLACNDRFRMLASLSMLHHGRQAALKNVFAHYRPRISEQGLTVTEGDYPSSLFLQAGARAVG